MGKNVYEHSLIFAPMEGITDQLFRRGLLKMFPEWDFAYTDFIRVPAALKFHPNFVLNHLDNEINEKVILQLLVAPNSNLELMMSEVNQLHLRHLDLNVGCPANKVCAHGAGSRLLERTDELEKIVGYIRDHFDGFFSVKIRNGYKTDENFIKVLKMLEHFKVDAITIHPRLKVEMYEGKANWDYIQNATEIIKTPIIGNGDIKGVNDIKDCLENYHCFGAMVGRGAVAHPEMAANYKGIENNHSVIDLCHYFLENIDNDVIALKRVKSLIAMSDITNKREMLRSQSLSEIETKIARAQI